MPLIQVQLFEGRSDEVKREYAKAITEAAVKIMDGNAMKVCILMPVLVVLLRTELNRCGNMHTAQQMAALSLEVLLIVVLFTRHCMVVISLPIIAADAFGPWCKTAPVVLQLPIMACLFRMHTPRLVKTCMDKPT